jgi:Uma2 family endonuclease
MVEAAVKLLDDDAIVLRRNAVRFPVELRPTGSEPDDLSDWPDVEGRLEWVDGRLLYMPPCADVQQEVAADVVHILRSWSDAHPEFIIGGNEAGMKLGNDIRAADAAIWKLADTGRSTGKLRSVPPVLAVEIAGEDEDEPFLHGKAQWYLRHGAEAVWIVLPEQREVLVVQRGGESRHGKEQRLPSIRELPGLAPEVAQFFAQIDRR